MYTILFYKGEPLDITETQRDELLKLMDHPTKKFALIKDRVVMFGNIADISNDKGYTDPILDMPYNSNQIEEPKTYVKPETKEKLDKIYRKSASKMDWK